MAKKIKEFLESETGKDVLVVLIVILVGISAFLLGRLSKKTENQGLRVEYRDHQSGALKDIPLASLASHGSEDPLGKGYFASSRGKKYYPVNCSAGKSIKLENRVYFSTPAEAESSGYELSSSCN